MNLLDFIYFPELMYSPTQLCWFGTLCLLLLGKNCVLVSAGIELAFFLAAVQCYVLDSVWLSSAYTMSRTFQRGGSVFGPRNVIFGAL